MLKSTTDICLVVPLSTLNNASYTFLTFFADVTDGLVRCGEVTSKKWPQSHKEAYSEGIWYRSRACRGRPWSPTTDIFLSWSLTTYFSDISTQIYVPLTPSSHTFESVFAHEGNGIGMCESNVWKFLEFCFNAKFLFLLNIAGNVCLLYLRIFPVNKLPN